MRTYKNRGKGGVIRERASFAGFFIVLLFTAVQTFAVENKTFYSSGQINPGEQWNVVEIYGDSTVVDMLGGLVDVTHSFDSSTSNITGGEISTLITSDYSTANVSSGFVGSCWAQDHSIFNVSGDVNIGVIATDFNSTFNLHGGYIYGIYLMANGTLNLYGGYIYSVISVMDNSMLNFYGGSVSGVVAVSDFGVMNLYGGGIEDWIGAWENGVINVFGHSLVKTNYGGIYDDGQIYGFWDDGTPFNMNLRWPETYLHINLIEIVDVRIHPKTLNLVSRGQWITCEIFIPEDYNAADVNSSSILLEDQIPADWIWFNEEQNVVSAKFNRSYVQEVLADSEDVLETGQAELTITGQLLDGTIFEGTDTIKVINKGHKNK